MEQAGGAHPDWRARKPHQYCLSPETNALVCLFRDAANKTEVKKYLDDVYETSRAL